MIFASDAYDNILSPYDTELNKVFWTNLHHLKSLATAVLVAWFLFPAFKTKIFGPYFIYFTTLHNNSPKS